MNDWMNESKNMLSGQRDFLSVYTYVYVYEDTGLPVSYNDIKTHWNNERKKNQ